MLRKRSRGVNSKPGVMADHGLLSSSSSSSTDIYSSPNSSFFNSSRHFTGFSTKVFSETEAVMSPTSILDSKPFSAIGNPFWPDKSPQSSDSQIDSRNPVNKIESRGVGLGIIEALDETPDMKFSKSDSRRVLFGSQLKIQIPEISQTGSFHSPREFGIKTRNSQMDCFSPSRSPYSGQKTPLGSTNFCQETPNTPSIITGSLSVSEMELSEDYTCVISHGPNPRTTHIFDNCIVESCAGFTNSKNEISFYGQPAYPSNSFLSFCYACKIKLGQGKDIYMYRGEKAFCSRECRHQEMLFDNDMEKPAFPDQLDELLDVADARS